MRRVWHGCVSWPTHYVPYMCVCGQAYVCVCVCIQTPSVWWPDTVWESVCRRRIHTQHKGPIMSPHSEKEEGVDEWIIGACPSQKGVWWFPCLSPRPPLSLSPLCPTTNKYVSTRTERGGNSFGEKQAFSFDFFVLWLRQLLMRDTFAVEKQD